LLPRENRAIDEKNVAEIHFTMAGAAVAECGFSGLASLEDEISAFY
jgi:hypothetical protein